MTTCRRRISNQMGWPGRANLSGSIFHQRNNDALMPFTAAQVDLMRRIYHGMVTMIDSEIGRIPRPARQSAE